MSENQLVRKGVFIDKMFDKIDSSDNALAIGKFIANSGMAPKHFKDNPAGLMLAIEAGAQLGLTWFHSIQNIAIINNIVMIMGDAAKAMILESGVCEDWEESEEGSWLKKDYVYIIKSKRKGKEKWEKETRFGYEDALLAGLTTKQGPWMQYPKGQCRYRALGFHARYSYPDVMKGFKTREEVMDYPETEIDAGYAHVISPDTTEALDAKAAITNIGKNAAAKADKKKVVKIDEKPVVDKPVETKVEEKPIVEEVLPIVNEPGNEEEDDDLLLEEEEPGGNYVEEQPEEPIVDVAEEMPVPEPEPEPKPEEVKKEAPKAEKAEKPKANPVKEEALNEDGNAMLREAVMEVLMEVQDGKLLSTTELGRRSFPSVMKLAEKLLGFTKFSKVPEFMNGAPKHPMWDTLISNKYPGKTFKVAYGSGQATKLLTEGNEEDIVQLILNIQ
jgi:hypothetical protein